MLSIFLLAFFLVQFLVIVGVLVVAVFFSRPEVPLKGDGQLERTAVDGGSEASAGQTAASRDPHTPRKHLIAVQPEVFATHSHSLGGGLY